MSDELKIPLSNITIINQLIILYLFCKDIVFIIFFKNMQVSIIG